MKEMVALDIVYHKWFFFDNVRNVYILFVKHYVLSVLIYVQYEGIIDLKHPI